MNLPETTFDSSMISQERALRADRAAISGSRFLTVLNTNVHRNTSQLLSDGCSVFACRNSSLPEEHIASNRSHAAWQLEQAEHSNSGPTAHAELHSLAIDERTMEHAQVGMPLAASQELLNTECVECRMTISEAEVCRLSVEVLPTTVIQNGNGFTSPTDRSLNESWDHEERNVD